MKKVLLSIGAVVASFGVYAQESDAELFDSFIQEALKSTQMVPSIGIAVVKDGKPVMIKGYGYADPQKGVKATGDTPYYIASITKSFTGLLAQMLADEGVIDLDAPLPTYKPFSQVKIRDMFEELTIRHLLNHTSGLDNGYITFREAYTGDKSAEILTMLLEEKTEKEKVGEFDYSNLGYNLFGLLLEAEFGWKWQDLLKERIFEPLNMSHTSAYISVAEKCNWGMAWPYLGYKGTEPERSYLMKNDDMMQSAGGMICSPKDAANWMIAYLNAGRLNGKQVLNPSLISTTLKATVKYEREGDIFNDKGYGMGWISATFKDEPINYHFGGYNGFFSHISIMPEKNIGIAVFANEIAFGDNVSNLIASFIYDYYLGNVSQNEDYKKEIKALEKRISDVQSSINKHYKKLGEREWKLELPKAAYSGEFANKHLGRLKIEEKGGDLHVTMGPLWAIATPYTATNSIRVEFAGSGEVLQFKIEDGEVIGIQYDNDFFKKS